MEKLIPGGIFLDFVEDGSETLIGLARGGREVIGWPGNPSGGDGGAGIEMYSLRARIFTYRRSCCSGFCVVALDGLEM